MTVTNDNPSVPHVVDFSTPLNDVIRHIKEDGAVIVRGFLDLEAIRKLQEEVDSAMEKGSFDPRYQEYNEEAGEVPKHEIYKHGEGKKTKHMKNLALTSQTFRNNVLNHKWMHDVCKNIYGVEFGDYWMNCAHILHLEPGEKAQFFHRDTGVYRVSDFRRQLNDPEFMINFLVSLTEFREDNGATQLIPGSHLWDATHPPTFYDSEEAVPAILQPGDAVVYLGSLFHGAGENRSSSYRRGMIVSMHPSHFTPMESHFHLPKDIVESMTPLAQQMVGWRTMYNQNKIPIWQAGDDKIEDVLRLHHKEVY